MTKIIYIVLSILLVISNIAMANDDAVLAKIGDRKLMMSEFNRILAYQDDDKKKAIKENPSFKVTILNRLVQGIVLSKIAREKEFDKRPDIKEFLSVIVNDFLAVQYITKELIEKINVSEEEMKTYYNTYQHEFRIPAQVKASHILIKADKAVPENDKKKAKEKAEDILKKVRAGEDFAKVATEFSEDPGTKSKGGDLGFFSKGAMTQEFEKAAFSLNPGEVSGLVETVFGYHIIKVEGKKEAMVAPYENIKAQVREKVLKELKKARLDDFMEKALKQADVQINHELLLPKE